MTIIADSCSAKEEYQSEKCPQCQKKLGEARLVAVQPLASGGLMFTLKCACDNTVCVKVSANL